MNVMEETNVEAYETASQIFRLHTERAFTDKNGNYRSFITFLINVVEDDEFDEDGEYLGFSKDDYIKTREIYDIWANSQE